MIRHRNHSFIAQAKRLERNARRWNEYIKFYNSNYPTQEELDYLFDLLDNEPQSDIRDSLIKKLECMLCYHTVEEETETDIKEEGEGRNGE